MRLSAITRLSQKLFFITLLLCFTVIAQAQAACVSPTGNEGDLSYDSASKTVYVCNGASWQSPGVPSGAIVMFDAACPSGWTRFAALDNRFPRGSATYGATGGSTSLPMNTTCVYDTICGYTGQTTVTQGTYWPPYLNVIWCKKN